MNVTGTVSLKFTRALRSRAFLLLWIGQTISIVGNGAYQIALAWQVLLQTGSGTTMGLVLVAASIPQIFFLLIGGVVADRLPRRRVLLWSDSGRAVVVLAIALLSWFRLLQIWELVAMSCFFGFVSGFFMPAYRAILPQLVDKEDLSSANALNSLTSRLALLFGPLLGASIIGFVNPAGAFALDGLTFVISAGCLLMSPGPSAPYISLQLAEDNLATGCQGQSLSVTSDRYRIRNIIKNMSIDIHEGGVYIVQSSWLWISIVVASLCNIATLGSLDVAMPKLIHDGYGMSVWLFGELGVASTLGSIIGALFIGRINESTRRGILAYICLVITSIGFFLFGMPLVSKNVVIIVVVTNIANMLIWFGLSTFSILWETLLQEFVPGDKLGRVSSVDFVGSLCLAPFAYALAGILTDRIGPSWIFTLSGILLLILSALALCIRDIRMLK